MRTKLITRKGVACYAPVLTAGIALAISFTLNACGSDDDPSDNPSSSSAGGGGSFVENSKVYDTKGAEYTGSGVIKLAFSDCDSKFNVGTVTDGIVNISLSNDVPSECLKVPEMPQGCTVTPSDAKSAEYEDERELFTLEDSEGKFIGYLQAVSEAYTHEPTSAEETYEKVKYSYTSKAGNVTCNNAVITSDGVIYDITFNMDFKTGWNKEYNQIVINIAEMKGTMKSSADPKTLTKEVKWRLF